MTWIPFPFLMTPAAPLAFKTSSFTSAGSFTVVRKRVAHQSTSLILSFPPNPSVIIAETLFSSAFSDP